MTEAKKPTTSDQGESKSALSGKQEFAGGAGEKLSHMGEKTRQAEGGARRPQEKPQKS